MEAPRWSLRNAHYLLVPELPDGLELPDPVEPVDPVVPAEPEELAVDDDAEEPEPNVPTSPPTVPLARVLIGWGAFAVVPPSKATVVPAAVPVPD